MKVKHLPNSKLEELVEISNNLKINGETDNFIVSALQNRLFVYSQLGYDVKEYYEILEVVR